MNGLATSHVLLTGGTGYIGRKLIERLTMERVRVTVLTRQALESTPTTDYVQIDGSLQSITDVIEMAQPNSVVHLAASYVRVHAPGDVSKLLDSNIGLGMRLIDAMARANTPRLVVAGSYFQSTGATQGAPRNLYAATKNAFDKVIEFYESIRAIQATSLEICDVYGEDDPRGRLMNAIAGALRSGDPLRLPRADVYVAPVHITDVVHAFEVAIAEPSRAGSRYWVGPTESILVGDVVRVFERVSGMRVHVELTDFQTLPGDAQRVVPGERLPGWQIEVNLEDGVERLLGSLDRKGSTIQNVRNP